MTQTEKELHRKLKTAIGLLVEMTSPDDDCFYDHHGSCQAHGCGEKPCPHERSKNLIAEVMFDDVTETS